MGANLVYHIKQPLYCLANYNGVRHVSSLNFTSKWLRFAYFCTIDLYFHFRQCTCKLFQQTGPCEIFFVFRIWLLGKRALSLYHTVRLPLNLEKLHINTSLAAKGALAHRLQCRTACKIQNPSTPSMRKGCDGGKKKREKNGGEKRGKKEGKDWWK